MGLEQKINSILMSHPKLKKIIKKSYQKLNVFINNPKKVEGNVVCVSPKDGFDYFFGYYDKSPWDSNNRYMLCMKAKDTSKEVAPKEKLEILLIDTANDNKVEKIAESLAWNVQQGCMAQWLGPNYNQEIIYNDFRNNHYCSIILNIKTKKERVIDFPVYSVSSDGKFAFSLDFSRLHRLRPGYGYSNLEDTTKDKKIPDSTCIWKIDLRENIIIPFLKYNDFYNFEQRADMIDAEHKLNHIMISPNNDKFMVIHRWLKGNTKYSRLVTCDIKSKKLYNLSDDNMVSHCCWKSNNEIIGFVKKEQGIGYYLMKDGSSKYSRINDYLCSDGHPSCNDNNLILTDSYPNKERVSTLRIMNGITSAIIGKVYNPFKYDNETRCDLHPRWSRDCKIVCFDGCFEGKRRLYIIPLSNLQLSGKDSIRKSVRKTGKYNILFILNTYRKSGPTQVINNIIKNLDLCKFNPIILTFNEETDTSMLKDIYPFISAHYYLPISKKDIIFGNRKKIIYFINKIKVDLIHTTGVFPDYAISKIKKYKQIVTLHNYAYYDYVSKFGKFKGMILAKMQLFAAANAAKTVTCSKSLSKMYFKNLNLKFDYIQNGIDVSTFKRDSYNSIRKDYNIAPNAFVFIYTGQFIARKNIDITLNAFNQLFNEDKNTVFILLGDGPERNKLRKKYNNNNIIFTGNVNNVEEFLCSSNVYISASKSEGLPNGVLEAMACELPVLLSNIPQHMEIIECNKNIGYTFSTDNLKEIKKCMNIIRKEKRLLFMSKNARKTVEKVFSDSVMSNKYQNLYEKIIDYGEYNEKN